ncbi:MAG: hypothetical protein AAF214_12555 [Pseudomonadota bacterium]
MTRLHHHPAIRARLRALRPWYNAVFRRQRDYSAAPTPAAYLQQMEGRGVFLLCFGRSGSTVFADYLGTHPKMMSFGEVLGEESFYSYFQWLSRGVLWIWPLRPTLMAREFYRYAARLVGRHTGMHCLFDIKIESLHLIEGNWRLPGPDFALYTHLREANAPVILLRREDLVARYVSGQVAERRGAYHSYQGAGAAAVAPFEIDLAAAKHQIAQIEASHAAIRAVFQGSPHFMELTYEQLFVPEGSGGTQFSPDLGARLANLLGVEDAFDPIPQLQRVSGGSGYADLITNWADVQRLQDQRGAPTSAQ